MAGRRDLKNYGFFWMDMAITGSARGILSAHGGLQAAMGGEFVSENPYYAIYDNAYPPRKRQRVMSYADYYAKYGTTEERDGWKMANPTGQKVIYVKS